MCSLGYRAARPTEGSQRVDTLFTLALALIVMILFMSFHWRANSWLVLANLPSASWAACWQSRHQLKFPSALSSDWSRSWVSARNAILQLAHYEHLVEVEGASGISTRRAWANGRLIPILMTAAVTALGLAPLAFGLHRPGQKLKARWRSRFGGLSSTV